MSLPDGWSLVSLDEMAAPEKGAIRRGPFGGSIKKEIFVSDGYKVYEQQNAIESDFEIGHYFIDERKYKEMEGFSVQPNDLIISCAGTIGRIAIAPCNARPGIINQALMRIRPNTSVVKPRYLKWFLESPLAQREIFGQVAGTALKNLTAISEIKKSQIPFPPLEEQHRIVTILDKADAVRRKRKEAIALTEELLRSAFLEMFGNPITNPKGWEVKPLEQVADLLTGYPFKSQDYVSSDIGIKLCRGANVLPDCVDWEDVCYWKRSEADQFERFKLQANDVVIALDRPWISSGFKIAVIMPQDLPALLVQRVARIRANQSEHQNYLYFLFRHPAFQKHCRPTETTVPHISPTDIKTYPVPVPPLGVIQQLDSLVIKHTDAKRKAISQCEQMEFLFNSLLQRAFRGEL